MKHEIYFSHPKANDDINKTIPLMIEVQTDAKAFESISKIINAQDYPDSMEVKTKHTMLGDWISVYVDDKIRLIIFDHQVSELRSFMVSDCAELRENLRELQKRYDKLDESYDRLVDENYGLTCERDGVKRTCEAKDAYISNLQVQISDLVERNKELNDRAQSAIKAKSIALEEMDNLRKELKSALESLHDQYDDSDKPCCKKCVHCRPFVGSTDCYCSQTAEIIKNEHAETYYCKNMIPYEDDYPF